MVTSSIVENPFVVPRIVMNLQWLIILAWSAAFWCRILKVFVRPRRVGPILSSVFSASARQPFPQEVLLDLATRSPG
jgi:hypothetical protein